MRSLSAKLIAVVGVAFIAAACAQSDAGITTAVKGKLAADNDVKAYQIDVETQDRVVTLTGTVENDAAKTRAVEIARGTDGVRSVTDRITVSDANLTSAPPSGSDAERTTGGATTDAGITAAVKSKFLGDPAVSGLKIDVDTRNGVVMLEGELRTKEEKDQALRLARETNGVRSEEHTCELQSQSNLVCRLLLEKKKKI